MLKRTDLAKQFEDIVKQEITNHNNQMLDTNTSINEFRKELTDYKDYRNHSNSTFASMLGKINTTLSELSKSNLDLSKKQLSIFNDQRVINERSCKNYQELVEGVNRALKLNSNLDISVKMLTGLINETNLLMSELQHSFMIQMEAFRISNHKNIQKSKEEILSLPCKATEVKNEIQKQMSVDRVDFEGVMRELEIIKKEKFIQEKKIEDLYTQLERLQKV